MKFPGPQHHRNETVLDLLLLFKYSKIWNVKTVLQRSILGYVLIFFFCSTALAADYLYPSRDGFQDEMNRGLCVSKPWAICRRTVQYCAQNHNRAHLVSTMVTRDGLELHGPLGQTAGKNPYSHRRFMALQGSKHLRFKLVKMLENLRCWESGGFYPKRIWTYITLKRHFYII